MPLTRQQLLQILPNAGPRAGIFLPALNRAMARYKIDHRMRQAASLARIGHESGQLLYTRELGGNAYLAKYDTGPLAKGLALPLLDEPELLEQPEWAAISAAWWWSVHGLNELADSGKFEAITRKINGGLNGLEDRLALHKWAQRVLAWKWQAMFALVLVAIACFSTWKVDAWRYGEQLAKQASQHRADLSAISNAGAALARAEQEKHLALEQRLQASELNHYKELSDVQRDQGRLRDRRATADLRLSVILAAPFDSGGGVQATSAPGSVDHGASRAQLAPAHAQRIIGINHDGDQVLIALAACQAYAREVSSR